MVSVTDALSAASRSSTARPWLPTSSSDAAPSVGAGGASDGHSRGWSVNGASAAYPAASSAASCALASRASALASASRAAAAAAAAAHGSVAVAHHLDVRLRRTEAQAAQVALERAVHFRRLLALALRLLDVQLRLLRDAQRHVLLGRRAGRVRRDVEVGGALDELDRERAARAHLVVEGRGRPRRGRRRRRGAPVMASLHAAEAALWAA